MNLATRIKGWFDTKSAGSPDWGTLERYLGWAFGGGASSSGIIVNPQTAMQAASVYACVKVLAESIGQLPFNTYRIGPAGKQLAIDHPLYELLAWQPNDYQTSVEFWEMMATHLNLRGNAYAYITRTRSGRIVELLPLHPDTVTVTMQDGWQLQYQIAIRENGGFKTLEPGEIMHIRGLTLNGWLGVSPIAYARESVGLALATEKFGGQLFRNGAKMGGVLEHPGKLSQDAYTRIKNSFDEATSGENAHKTALLEEGMKFNKISLNADDAQFLETRKFQRGEIASIFRVPPHLIGDLEHATFGNIEHQSLEFVKFTLQPWLNRIVEAVRRDLFSADDKKNLLIQFDTRELLSGDASARANYYTSGINAGWLTRNEARNFEGLNSIDGLDEPLRPLNMVENDDAPDPDKGTDEEDQDTGDGNETP